MDQIKGERYALVDRDGLVVNVIMAEPADIPGLEDTLKLTAVASPDASPGWRRAPDGTLVPPPPGPPPPPSPKVLARQALLDAAKPTATLADIQNALAKLADAI